MTTFFAVFFYLAGILAEYYEQRIKKGTVFCIFTLEGEEALHYRVSMVQLCNIHIRNDTIFTFPDKRWLVEVQKLQKNNFKAET